MQSLALENYGTSELSFDEQRETDGGNAWVVFAAAALTAIAWDTLINPSGCVESLKAGFASTQKK